AAHASPLERARGIWMLVALDHGARAVKSAARARAAVAAVLGAFVAACAPASRGDEPLNVVLVCLDTVRADHLGCYGYARATTPALDALAARALVFDEASSNASWTKPSVPSFLTGTYPCQNGVYEGSRQTAEGETTDVLPEKALTLAEAFQQH